LQFQLAGTPKWNIGNLYNAGANDFVLTDVLNTVNRLVIKNTGLATYTGFFNVANIASAQNIQISGTAPAYTIVEGTGNANTASIGIASIANNFIQGSVEGDLCIVSQSTSAKRLLLGVQSANSSAICISASNNVLINSIIDNGYKFFVNGSTNITGLATFGNVVQIAGGAGVPASGAGLELAGTTSIGNITSFNRTLGTYLPLVFNCLSYTFYRSGTQCFAIASSGIVNITNTPEYATNALALAGGLVAGDIYKSATGILSIVY